MAVVKSWLCLFVCKCTNRWLRCNWRAKRKNKLGHFPGFKWTYIVYFSSSLYIINQKPMIHRTYFHCITTWVVRSSGRNSAVRLLILWFGFISQMALLFNMNFYFDCKIRLGLIVPGKQEKIYFCTRKFLSTRSTQRDQWSEHVFSWL